MGFDHPSDHHITGIVAPPEIRHAKRKFSWSKKNSAVCQSSIRCNKSWRRDKETYRKTSTIESISGQAKCLSDPKNDA
jgi:hypothetical protein